MRRPLISVVIPTHNRSQYAIESITSILSLSSQEIELVISDTSDTELLEVSYPERFSKLLQDKRFKYFRPNQKLDMTGNHNFCLEKASGEYVCLIGDDDTITGDLVLVAKWAKENAIEVVSPIISSNYAWPDFYSNMFGWGHAGRLYVPRSLRTLRSVKSQVTLKKWLDSACQGTDGMPKIYHGLVSREVISRITSDSRQFFFGSSPDVSGAVALAASEVEYCEIDFPVTIPGASGGSNTGRSAVNKHKGSLESEGQTTKFVNTGWDARIPKFFSVETVWAHAAVETLKQVRPDQIIDFGFVELYAQCLGKHFDYRADVFQAIEIYTSISGQSKIKTYLKLSFRLAMFLLRRARYVSRRILIPTASGGRKHYSEIENINIASSRLKDYMSSKGWSWAGFLKNNQLSNIKNSSGNVGTK